MLTLTSRLQHGLWLSGGLGLILLLLYWVPLPHLLQGSMRYTPLHTLLEIISVVISALAFSVAWSAYHPERPVNLLILASALLGTALLDTMHLLGYPGMPDFITPSSPEKAINYWLAARLLLAVALTVSALRSWTPLRNPNSRFLLVGAIIASAVLLIIVLKLWMYQLPRTFTSEGGLTPHKIGAEYAIIALMLVPAAVFFNRAKASCDYDAATLFTATIIAILSELCFTLYHDVTDTYNLLGHIYKIVAYGLFYSAIFNSVVRQPMHVLSQSQKEAALRFEQLLESEQEMHQLLDDLPSGVVVHNLDTSIHYANPAAQDVLGLRGPQILSRKADPGQWRFLRPDGSEMPEEEYPVRRVLKDGAPHYGIELGVLPPNSVTPRWCYANAYPMRGEQQQMNRVLVAFIDISARKNAEQAGRSNDSENRIRAAKEGERLWQSLIRATPDTIFRLDPDLRISYSNRSFHGNAQGQLLHTKLTHYVDSSDRKRIRMTLEMALKSGESCVAAMRMVGEDGGNLQYTLYVSPIFSENGVSELLVVLRDSAAQRY